MAAKQRQAQARSAKGAEDSEAAFLAAYDPSRFERPSVAVDVALLSVVDAALYTLGVYRDEHPFKGRWALPGGFVRMEESLDAAATRVLATKAGLTRVFLEQLYTFGAPRRDPRTRVLSVAYYALVDHGRFAAARASEGFGAEGAVRRPGAPSDNRVARVVTPWEGETGGPVDLVNAAGEPVALAFDHAEILGMAVKRIRGKLDYTPIGFQLLPERFTLFELQKVHETVLGRPLNKDSFRRRMLASDDLEATGESEKAVDHRPAELYRFVRRSAV